MNDFQLELAQNLIDQIDSDVQQKKVLKLVISDGLIISVNKNEYFVKSSENRYKVYHVFFSINRGWLCNCKWYTIDLKQTKSCSHIIACRIYQILYHQNMNTKK